MPEKMIEVFSRRPGRGEYLLSAARDAGWTEKTGLRLLEAGCGLGAASKLMSERLGAEVTGVDLDAELIERASCERPERCRFLYADATALPFGDGSFDGVFSEAAFSVLPDRAAAAREYARLLIPGGRIIISDFCARRRPEPELRALVRGVPCFEGVDTVDSYAETLEAAGFRVLEAGEDYGEFLKLIMYVGREYKVRPDETGGFLSANFGSSGAGGEFFKKARMSWCRLILAKK